MIVIYKITSPSSRIYIGQTKSFETRKSAYRNTKRVKTQTKLQSSILKHGWETHKMEIIDSCESKQEGYILETYYIDLYNSFKKGLNGTPTGNPLVYLSPIYRGKGVESYKKNYTKEKHPMYGKKHRQESKEKMSKKRQGYTNSKITRERMSEAHTGTRNESRASLPVDKVLEIKNLLSIGKSMVSISRDSEISYGVIVGIKMGSTYKYVNSK